MGLRDLIGVAVKPRLDVRFATLLDDEVIFEDGISSEYHDEKGELQSLSGLSLVIEYTDSKGATSQRLITCQHYAVRADKEYIRAYCHHRKSLRSFRLDRIVDVYDAATGESLSPVQAFFARFSPDSIAKSGLSWGLTVGLKADLVALINALVFVARCDREFHPSEVSCLEKAITSFWIRMEIETDADFDDILKYSHKLAPDGETFWLAMQRFREAPVLAAVFRRHAQFLIEADGIIRSEEAYYMVEIDDFLNDA